MAFLPINFEEGKIVKLPMTAATYTLGQALKCTSGSYITATASQGTDVEAVSMENKVVASTGDLMACIVTRGVRFLADTNGTPTLAQQGTSVDLASATTIDETAAAGDYLFYIEKVVGPLADKKVQGFFQHGTILA